MTFDTRARVRRPQVSTVLKYLATVLGTLFCWALVIPLADPDDVPSIVATKVNLDLALGLLAIPFLPLRHRYPLVLASVYSVLLVFSSALTGSWAFAAITLAEQRRVPRSTAMIVLSTAASMLSLWWMPPLPGEEYAPWWATLAVTVLIYTLITSVGFYSGARADLIRSWQERAQTAEREHASRMAQARVAERTRIAREMHDVLAHRISTVAMHSGALSYRTDLGPDEVRDAARLIQENAHSALIELRDILGVLRDDSHPEGAPTGVEPPQPTITDIDDLVANARGTGQEVRLILDVDPADIPSTLGRHVYRSVQECLTNARKHAPGAAVDISVTRHRGRTHDDLVVEVSNPLSPGLPRAEYPSMEEVEDHGPQVPSSGVGLLGLAERADLVGGRLEHGPRDERYVTRLIVPWPERSSA